MRGDVLRLLHGANYVPVHRLEGGVVGGVSEVEDASHLDGDVGVHLNKSLSLDNMISVN